jgi:Flp pilus assembly protein TadB
MRANGMIGRMRRHERYVRQMLERDLDAGALRELAEEHNRQVGWMQHERLVHLLVMLFVCLFTLLALGLAILDPALPHFILFGLLAVLAAAYIAHYYRLENGVQRWYGLHDEIREKRG